MKKREKFAKQDKRNEVLAELGAALDEIDEITERFDRRKADLVTLENELSRAIKRRDAAAEAVANLFKP